MILTNGTLPEREINKLPNDIRFKPKDEVTTEMPLSKTQSSKLVFGHVYYGKSCW